MGSAKKDYYGQRKEPVLRDTCVVCRESDYMNGEHTRCGSEKCNLKWAFKVENST